jgi:hypothetical protein
MGENSNFDPAIETRARAYLQRYLAGDLDPSELVFGRPRPAEAPTLAPTLAAGIRELFGDPELVEFVSSSTNASGITTYRFNIAFSDAQLEYHFGIYPNGKVNQFGITWVPGDTTNTKARLKQRYGLP